MTTTKERTERLRVLLEVAPYLPLSPEEAAEYLTAEDAERIQQLTTDDLDLANACLVVEAQLRLEQLSAVEELMALVAAGEGGLDERVRALPRPQKVAAVAAIVAAMWVDY